jgi:hypothetical protein
LAATCCKSTTLAVTETLGVALLREWLMRRSGNAFARCKVAVFSTCAVFGKRHNDQLNVKFELKRTSTGATGFGALTIVEVSVGGSGQ